MTADGAVLQERIDLAREIDDSLARSLATLCLHLEAVRAVLEKHDIYRGLQLLHSAHRMASNGLTDSRRAVDTLRGTVTGLDGQLGEMVAQHRRRHDTAVELTVLGEQGVLPPPHIVALLRVAQDALSNAASHAPGRPVLVCLDWSGTDVVSLTVTNDRAERDQEPVPGLILTGAGDELRLVDGSLRAAFDERQWIVTAEVPRADRG